MTPEEKKAQEILDSNAFDSYYVDIRLEYESQARDFLAQAIREAKAEAYEEAALQCDGLNGGLGDHFEAADAALDNAAENIRALKDSLVETAST